jgi:GTP-binding protein HflX
VATAVLVGYTNAGKSTLLNRLTSANVVARDQLFSTLDTTTRKLYLGERKMLLLSDTVGFITDLPEPLLAAFRATLEVVEEADLILHVVDASSPHIDLEMEAVAGLMRELGGDKKPTVTVFNKWDCVKSKQAVYAAMEWLEPSPSLVLSATQDRTLQPLIDLLESLFEIYSPQGQWETARLVAGGV